MVLCFYDLQDDNLFNCKRTNQSRALSELKHVVASTGILSEQAIWNLNLDYLT